MPHVLRRFKLTEEENWCINDFWSHPLGARLRDTGFAAHQCLQCSRPDDHSGGVRPRRRLRLQPDRPRRPGADRLPGIPQGALGLATRRQRSRRPLRHRRTGTFPALAAEFSRQVRGHYVVVSQQLIQQIESYGVTLHGDVEVMPATGSSATGPRADRVPPRRDAPDHVGGSGLDGTRGSMS